MGRKKSFEDTDNPAVDSVKHFISNTAPDTKTQEPTDSKPPDGYKALYVETRSRRLQLLVQPSLYSALKARAAAEGKSVNELAHSILVAGVTADPGPVAGGHR